MKKVYWPNTGITTNESTEGEMLEHKIERRLKNKETLQEETVPLIYGERSEGVKAGHNIRTDRMEVALEATNMISKSVEAKRNSRMNIVKDEPAQGKAEGTTATE